MGALYAVKGINTIHAFYGINIQYAFSGIPDANARRIVYRRGRTGVRGSRSILQGFLTVGSNFLDLGTPLPALPHKLRNAL